MNKKHARLISTPMLFDTQMHKTPEGKSYLVKHCSKCKVWKRVFPLGPDGRKVRRPNGDPKMAFSKHHHTTSGLQSSCIDCRMQIRMTKEGRAKQMYQSAKNKNPERILLTKEEWVALFMRLWDEQEGRCSKTGWAFTLTQGADTRINPFAPCFDRIDNSGKYESSNIQLVCCMYNSAKSDYSNELMQEMCAAVVATAGN